MCKSMPDFRGHTKFLPTVPTFAVRETDVSRHNEGTSGAPIKPLRDDSALRALSSLSTVNVGTVGMNGLCAISGYARDVWVLGA